MDTRFGTEYFTNREFSALSFNARILAQAKDERTPLLERLRYLFIASSNLDEFFEIRVASIKQRIALQAEKVSIDGLRSEALYHEISRIAHTLSDDLYHTYTHILLPALKQENITILPPQQWSHDITNWIEHYFIEAVLPVVSPVGLDPSHPFPRLVNKSLNFVVALKGEDAFGRSVDYAIVHAPRALPRIIPLPAHLCQGKHGFIYLSTIIQTYVKYLFPGMTIKGCYPFRLTRNSNLFVHQEEIEDMASAVEMELLSRNYGHVVRLEIHKQCPEKVIHFLLSKHHISEKDVYRCDGPVNLHRYMDIIDHVHRPELLYPPFVPIRPQAFQRKRSVFDVIQEQDVILHHPYESFSTVIDFVKQAASDPDVLAIKQTLYRTHSNSAMVRALVEAAHSGKEVTAVIELRARFDEESNLKLANKLHSAGAMVLYGVVGYKTHAKMTLVVREEAHGIKRYVHLGTGNYHERTAKLYTDFGLLTCNKAIGQDVQDLFHQLTGVGKIASLKKLHYSPFSLQKYLLRKINKAIREAQEGAKPLLCFKINGLTDRKIISALYRASQAGVRIYLIVRSLCCLKPGIPGVSDNITVFSVIGRFLEHHRLYYFQYQHKEEMYGSSADLMERNLYKRVEILFPILDNACFQKLKTDIIDNYLHHQADTWVLQANGQYEKVCKKNRHAAQQALLEKYQPTSD